VAVFMDAVAPALLVAQGVGRIGNYFNKELFGKPTGLPWGLKIPLAYRPPGFTRYSYFQPTFLYELIFDLLLAAALVWLGHHRRIKPPGLFALYMAGYSAFRIFEETVRIDSSAHFLGLRLNFFVALVLTLIGLAWFAQSQRSRRHSADEMAGGPADPADPADPDADQSGLADPAAPADPAAGESGSADPDAATPAAPVAETTETAAGPEEAAGKHVPAGTGQTLPRKRFTQLRGAFPRERG
jgi:hypothetical protein